MFIEARVVQFSVVGDQTSIGRTPLPSAGAEVFPPPVTSTVPSGMVYDVVEYAG